MDRNRMSRRAAAGLIMLLAVFGAGLALGRLFTPAQARASVESVAFTPQPDSAIPDDELGRQIRLGRKIFTDTAHAVPQFSGNDLACSNCHLDAGRRPRAAPLWAAYGLFPQYRAKNGHVNTFAERVRECFMYSMNGHAPPYGDPALVAIESYAAFLARGAPIGVVLPGQGYARLQPPALPVDRARGAAVFQANCVQCHGPEGAGLTTTDGVVVPPLWGPRSFNWGAGMGEIRNAAGFIRYNMPQDRPGALTDQQAWDVAAFIDGKPRPQDPRFTGSPAQTRKLFHDTPQSLYGQVVDGVLLGAEPARP